ncbi:hypothetical protein FRC03_003690 [Tulasnella sp. 419]|nr:hypothetical protein FRC02_009468 [Tulasnella sp. 418]KAG8942056.1 hypothetical protein FRC03_003690 [Tulasnella sp. 419]
MPSVLRKDGVLLMGSGEVQFCTEDKTFCPIDVEEGQPDWYAIQTIFREGFKDQLIRGGGAEIKRRWEILLGENPFLSSFGVDDVYVPIGPWLTDQDDTSVYASKLMQSNILHLIGALRYRLVSNGLDEATIDRWAKIAKEEVTNMNPKLYVKWRYAWGVRNSLEWVPKPVDSITKS